MPRDDGSSFDLRLARALGHSLRFSVLELLQDRVATKRELAASLKTTPSKLEYHLNVLLDADCIAVVNGRSGKGPTAYLYSARPGRFFGSLEWDSVPPSVRGFVTHAALSDFLERLTSTADGIEQKDRESVFLKETFFLDDVGWKFATQLVQGLLLGMRELQDQCRARAYVKEADLSPTVVGLAMFESERLDRGGSGD